MEAWIRRTQAFPEGLQETSFVSWVRLTWPPPAEGNLISSLT